MVSRPLATTATTIETTTVTNTQQACLAYNNWNSSQSLGVRSIYSRAAVYAIYACMHASVYAHIEKAARHTARIRTALKHGS